MTTEELNSIKENNSAYIIAAAGHGKTEMITDIVANTSGRSLILTHTNAGVDALKKRLLKKNVPNGRYKVETIASFCVRWCHAYKNISKISLELTPYRKEDQQKYYAQHYSGAKAIFQYEWAGKVLKNSYTRVIVDEYQDCTVNQHEVIKELNKYLPTTVLGDPLQGIFGFKKEEPLVDWNSLEFSEIKIETYPWRWKDTNPGLGSYLSELRDIIYAPALSNKTVTININPYSDVIVIKPENFDIFKLYPQLREFDTVLYITKWESDQIEFCKRTRGLFQNDEKQDCTDLFMFAEAFDKTQGCELAKSVLEFVQKCAVNISSELESYFNRLNKGSCDFSRIEKHRDIGELVERVCKTSDYNDIYDLINCFRNSEFKIYRKELYYEMLRSIKYAVSHGESILVSANHVRKDAHLQKRYTQFNLLCSRTLLSKGLEFDCVIIDMKTPLSVKEFYVAMTRAMKKIYIISESDTLILK